LLVGERMHVHVGMCHLLHQVPGLGPGDGQNGEHGSDVLQSDRVVAGQMICHPLKDSRLLLCRADHEVRRVVLTDEQAIIFVPT